VTSETKATIYRLAKECNEWDVRKMCERLTTKDLIEWIGYWRWEAAMLDQAKQREIIKNE
jgi:hypothetical protein